MKKHIEGVLWTFSVGVPFVAGLVGPSHLFLPIFGVWLLSTAIVIPLHFCRAWKRWAVVTNRREYALWVGFETAATLALVSLVICAVIFG